MNVKYQTQRMIPITSIAESISVPTVSNKKIQLTNVELEEPFPPSAKEPSLIEEYLTPAARKIQEHDLTPVYPNDYDILGIDSTGFRLGIVEDGQVGVVRTSVIIKNKNEKERRLIRQGPFPFAVTNLTRQDIFDGLYSQVYNLSPNPARKAPDSLKMLERIRAIFERHAQMECMQEHSKSIILIDGSFIGGTQDTPSLFMKQMIDTALQNENIPIAISKETNLTLSDSGKSILSLAENKDKMSYIGPLNPYITQDPGRYHGNIYVARLKPFGEPFRIDIPKTLPIKTDKLFSYISGIAGDFGYPEELKLAHSTCVLSSLEILECQAAAVAKYGMWIEPDMHHRLFVPFR